MRTILIVGAGGFIGSVARHLTQVGVSKFIPSMFPYGTFFVNIVGCFLIGLIYGVADRGNVLTPEWRFFLTTGFCGGFTTFSAFSYDAFNLMKAGQYTSLSLYVILSVALGMFATVMAISLVRSI